jgi:hypothetical protein
MRRCSQTTPLGIRSRDHEQAVVMGRACRELVVGVQGGWGLCASGILVWAWQGREGLALPSWDF